MPPAAPSQAFPQLPLAPADAAHSRRSEASLVALHNGSVLLAYGRHTGPNDPGYARLKSERVVRYGGASAIERDNDFGEIVAVRLDALGRRQTEERVLVPAPADGLNAMSPALRRLPDGRLGMLYSHRQSTRVASRWRAGSLQAPTSSLRISARARWTSLASGTTRSPRRIRA